VLRPSHGFTADFQNGAALHSLRVMLRIGHRSYELVRPVSHFHVTIGGRRREATDQQWMLDAHYVPSAEDHGRENGDWEYLRLTIHPFGFKVSDWRELAKFGVDLQEDGVPDPVLFHTNMENLLAHHGERRREKCHAVGPGMFKARASGGYLFTCEFDGAFEDDEGEKEFTLLDEIPFGSVTVHPAINVKDPVAAGRAIAAREIKLTEFEGSHVTPPDWRRGEKADAPLDSYHHVTLRTPWHRVS
jgi:hypothetical protein